MTDEEREWVAMMRSRGNAATADVRKLLCLLTTAEAERDAAVRERDELRADIDKTHTIALEVMRERDAAERERRLTHQNACDYAARLKTERDEALSRAEHAEQCLIDRIENRMDGAEALDAARRAAFDEVIDAFEKKLEGLNGMPGVRLTRAGIRECIKIVRALRDASGAR